MATEQELNNGVTYPRGFQRDTKWAWRLVPARTLVTLNYGRALKADTRQPGGTPVYGTNGQCGTHSKPLVRGPGVVLGRKGQGPLGVEWCETDFWVIDTAYYATPLIQDLDLKYFYYLVKYVGLNHLKDGTSNPTLSRDSFGAQLYPHPPLTEQRAIANILGTLDDKIELNRRMNQTQEAMAQALFKEWFVDPVKDRLPKGWREGCISDFADIRTQVLNPGALPSRTWEHYSIPAFDEGRSPALDLGESIKSNKYRVPSSAVLVSKLNPATPRVWLPDVSDPTAAICSTEFVPFVPHEPVRRHFLFELLRSDSISEETAGRATGTTGSRQRVSPTDIAAISCPVPPPQLVDKFSAMASAIHSRVAANLHESRSISQIRDTLLPRLLSGELRIKDAEVFLEAQL